MRGFTLLETLIVLAIIGLVSSAIGAVIWHILIIPKTSSEGLAHMMDAKNFEMRLGKEIRTSFDEEGKIIKTEYEGTPIFISRKGFSEKSPRAIFTRSLIWEAPSSEVIGDVYSERMLVRGKNVYFLGLVESKSIRKIGDVYAELENLSPPEREFPKISEEEFKPPTYKFKGDVNLNRVEYVWEGKRLKSGVYLADGDMRLKGKDIKGNVTFVAKRIIIEGDGFSLKGYKKDTLLLAEKIYLYLKNSSTYGIIYSKKTAEIEADDLWIRGGVICGSLKVKGKEIKIQTPRSLYGCL